VDLPDLVRTARPFSDRSEAMNRPVAHFVLWGALLFAGERGVLALRTHLEAGQETASTPRGGTESGFLSPDDALLYREAMAQRLYESDPVVHRRLVENLRFLGLGEGEPEAALARDALALGFHRSDPVVQRRLVNVMRLQLEGVEDPVEPTDDELRAELAAHHERWEEPARVTMVHVFLSRERRGPALEVDAHRLLRTLRGRGAPPEKTTQFGDPFPEPLSLTSLSQHELARIVGPETAAVALATPPGAWSEPAPSAFGIHLFFVRERTSARAPSLETVRSAVREALLAERADRTLARRLAELRTEAPRGGEHGG